MHHSGFINSSFGGFNCNKSWYKHKRLWETITNWHLLADWSLGLRRKWHNFSGENVVKLRTRRVLTRLFVLSRINPRLLFSEWRVLILRWRRRLMICGDDITPRGSPSLMPWIRRGRDNRTSDPPPPLLSSALSILASSWYSRSLHSDLIKQDSSY